MNKETIEKPRLVLVEGKDEVGFFKRLFSDSGRADDYQILDAGGKDHFPENIKAISKSPGFHLVEQAYLLRDADDNCNAAFDSIVGALKNSDYDWPIPKQPLENALGTPNVKIFILPDNQNPGALELLFLSSIGSKPQMGCIDLFFQCLKENDIKFRNDNLLHKKRAQSYLATLNEECSQLGLAAQQGHVDFDSAVFAPLRQFFDLESL